jgi:TusA-related sulfurtransferase
MARQIDARGSSCPQPAIMAWNAIKEAEFPIEVLVETVTSRENVRRASEKMGCIVEVEEPGDEFKLILTN